MTLNLDTLAQSYIDRADADVDAAFNARHELARSEAAAVESIEAAGRERWRRDQLARAAAAAAANGNDGSARFGPLDDDEPEATVVPTAPTTSRARTAGNPNDDGDDEEAQQTWLR